MVNKLNTFILLMWKHWTLAKRSPCQTFYELFFSIALGLIFLKIFRYRVEQEQSKSFKPFYTNFTNTLCSNSSTTIAIAPKSKIVNQVVDRILIDCPKINFTKYENSQQLNKEILSNNFYAAIQFDNSFKNINKNIDLPSDLKVTIRIQSDDGSKIWDWFTQLLYPLITNRGPRNTIATGGEPEYQNRGFLLLQQLITLAVINNNKSAEPRIIMCKYPYPPSVQDKSYIDNKISFVLPCSILLIFWKPFTLMLTYIETEKEQQLTETMKVMGVPLWLNWMTWFIRGFIILFIRIIVTIFFLKINFIRKPYFFKTDTTLLFIFLMIYGCNVITTTFLISVFFSNTNAVGTVDSITFFLSAVPYLIIVINYLTTSFEIKLGVSVLGNSAMGFGMLLITRFESFEEGAQWTNLWDHVTPDDNLSLGYIMLMLIFDTFLYLIIALYIEAIFPREFGVSKPWYFPILFLLSCCKVNKVSETDSSNEGEFFEKFTEDLPKGIQLKNLSKSFHRKNVVNNLNLDIYEGHITVLLGHNGAGKTTTMSMISGMCPPTSGTVIVNGYDLRTHIDQVRNSMGLCFQHNVLFDTLTVEEHLYFFSQLKGLERQQLNAEINYYLNSVGLGIKKDEQIKKLSEGMKRKLSVALAFCGKSKVVLLDEPTSGMDPSAREIVQHLIQREKRGRTILLTTHSMDEADLLGDRIAIMAAGELQCCGSNFFLKKKLAAGYYLIMEVSRNCNPQSVTSLLKMYIPQVKLYSHVGSELTYQLPESESSKFERTLQQLESNSGQLGIVNYGISYATLDQVFMKVGVDDKNKISKQPQDAFENRSKINYLTGCSLMANQFFAMFSKKLLSIFRNWILYFFQITTTIFMLLFFFIFYQQSGGRQNNFPLLKITLDSYPNSVTLISGDERDPLFLSYKSVLSGHGKLWEVIDISKTILSKKKTDPRVVKISYIVGASFDKNVTTAWFNGDPYHSAPLALSLVLNSLYKYHLGKEKSISFINHPLPPDLKLQILEQFNFDGLILFVALGYAMSFMVHFYIIFYIKERVRKSRHLQYASGTNGFVFWMAAFLTDLLIYILSLIPIIIIIAILKIESFRTLEEIGRLTLLLITFGFSVLPFLYLFSCCFSSPSKGFSVMFTTAILFGPVGVLIVYLLRVKQVSERAALTLNYIFLFITPFYAFCKSIFDLNLNYASIKSCSENGSPEESCKILQKTSCCDIKDYFSMTPPGIGLNILILFIMFLLFLTLLIAKNIFFAPILRENHEVKPPEPVTDLDDDVEEEIKKIKTIPENVLNKENCLVLNDVTKYYKKDPVVNGLCLAVKPFECFGLLGVNGAGKTTTFKMLTGDIDFSYGNAWLKGLNLKTQLKNAQKLIGYCPQFDALLEELTVRDTLKIFALIRGIPRGKCKKLAEELAQELDFSKHIDKPIKHLSGGTKRKVSSAVAVIGEPPVIFLDEPTTGIDPSSKRHVWKYFCKLRDRGKCIILTSHSMEECEALCTRIAIMVNGNFQCLGSVQHLKNKFAQGYFLTVTVKKVENVSLNDSISGIELFVKKNFPNAKMEGKYEELLTFQLPKSTIPWSQIFGLFERHKKKLNIEDYSVGQCSLNQVFLSFAKQQIQEYDNMSQDLNSCL